MQPTRENAAYFLGIVRQLSIRLTADDFCREVLRHWPDAHTAIVVTVQEGGLRLLESVVVEDVRLTTEELGGDEKYFRLGELAGNFVQHAEWGWNDFEIELDLYALPNRRMGWLPKHEWRDALHFLQHEPSLNSLLDEE